MLVSSFGLHLNFQTISSGSYVNEICFKDFLKKNSKERAFIVLCYMLFLIIIVCAKGLLFSSLKTNVIPFETGYDFPVKVNLLVLIMSLS